MIARLTAAGKRLRLRHYLLIFLLALVLLLVGLVLKGYIAVPARLAHQFPFLLAVQPTAAAQAQLPQTTPAAAPEQPSVAATMPGMDHGSMPMEAPEAQVTATPTSSAPMATSTGIVTVITLTPTPAVTAAATVAMPTGTEQVVPEEGQPADPTATQALPADLTPTISPTSTLPGAAISTPLAESDVNLAQIRADMEALDRILLATRVLMKTFSQGQPTAEEETAVRAQLTVVAQRMSRLAAQLRAAQASMGILPETTQVPPTATPTPTAVANTSPSPEQIQNLLGQMQTTLEVLQGVIADPATDEATLAQAQALLGQLQEMMNQLLEQLQSMQP